MSDNAEWLAAIKRERDGFLEELRLAVKALWAIEYTDEIEENRRAADELRDLARKALAELEALDDKYGFDLNHPSYSENIKPK